MNKKYPNHISVAHRIISLVLAFSLLTNLAAPAAAQKRPSFTPKTRSYNRYRQELTVPQDNTRITGIEQRVQMKIAEEEASKGNLSNEQVRRLLEISRILSDQAPKDQKTDEQLFSEAYTQAIEEVTAQSQADIKQQAANRRAEIKQAAKNTPEGATPEEIEAWINEANAELDAWQKKSLQDLKSWKKKQLARTKQVFQQEGENKLLKQREQAVREMVSDLWKFQNYQSSMARGVLLDVAPTLAALKTMDGKSFFSDKQIRWLEQQYTKILENSKDPKICQDPNNHKCKRMFMALTGLSILGNHSSASYAIVDLIDAYAKTEMAVPVITSGFAALIARKEYSSIKGSLHQFTQKETLLDNFDMLSVSTWVEAAANINGQYLGEVSKFAQYPLTEKANEKSALGNAWEDVALLLAEDNNPAGLEILRQYGVETCRVYTDVNLKMERKIKGLRCNGIIPFIVGALESGKSGANQYAPKLRSEIVGPHISNTSTINVTPQQAAANQQYNRDVASLFRQYAAQMGLTPEAAVARHLFTQSMGDLSAESELALDTKLYKVYEKSAKARAPKPGYAITPYSRGSATYNAKSVRQDRVSFFRKAAVFADIAILLWCIYDITKWGRTAYKVGKGILSASKMSRGGATVAQRAMMLRRLNIAPKLRAFVSIPSKIRAGMEPVVLAQAPLFTNALKMPQLPEFVQAAGKVVTQGARFSTETGVLGVNVQELVASANGQLNLQQSFRLNAALNDASAAANTAFANRTWTQRLFTFNKDASYRSYLSGALLKQGRLPGLTMPESFQFAAQIKSMPGITLPANINTFKAPQLFAGGSLQMPALQRVIGTTLGANVSASTTQHTASLLETALHDTNVQFASRGWFSRNWNTMLGRSNTQYKRMLLDNMAAVFDADGMLFTNPGQYKIYQSLVSTVTSDLTLRAPGAGVLSGLRHTPARTPKVEYKAMGSAILNSTDASVTPTELPLNILMDTGIKGVERTGYQRVLFTDKGSSFLFGIGNNLSKPFQPQSFKITLDAQNIPSVIRAAAATPLAKPFEIKLTPQLTRPGWFARRREGFNLRAQAFQAARAEGKKLPLGTLMRGKENIYIHDIPVFLRQADGSLAAAPMIFKADSYLGFKGVQSVLEADGTLAWYRGAQRLQSVPGFTYGLPKNQLKPFLSLTRASDMPLTLRINSGRNKLTPLMWSTGLSLSAASSSLIPSLESNYGDRITETDKTMISLALPYLPSFAAPALSPIVMKLGALRTLQLALGVSTAGLAFTAANGFRGRLDHENLPPIWPLYVSGTAIGISSALSRASLNLLIDRMGGGGSLLKSMAFKNIGSFSLLVPQIALSSAGLKTDFSFAFPFTGALSLGALMWVSSSRIDANIGRVANFMKTSKLEWNNPITLPKTIMSNARIIAKEGWRETWSSIRLLGTKELLLPTLAATAFTGFEASSFNKASNQLIRPKVEGTNFIQGFDDSTDRKNWTSLLTSGTVVAFPLLTRFGAKPLLKAMSNPLNPGIEYKRMLLGSLALNVGGLTLLMNEGFDGFDSKGFLGIAMIGVGTANMTQSLQKLSNLEILHSGYVLKRTAGMSAAEAALFRQTTVTKAMTSFPVSQLGLALLPLAVSRYTDDQIERGVETKANAPHSSLWIPMTSIVGSAALASPLILKMPKLPAGMFGLGKGVIGSYPGAWNNLMHPTPQSYMGLPADAPLFPRPSIKYLPADIPVQPAPEAEAPEIKTDGITEEAATDGESSEAEETAEPAK